MQTAERGDVGRIKTSWTTLSTQRSDVRPRFIASAVAALFVVGAFVSVAGAVRPAGPGEPSAAAIPGAPVASPGPAFSTSQLGACDAAAAPAAAASPATFPASTTPPPLYNSQVEPYAIYTGPYAYVAGGAAMRDLGSGSINLTWPGGTSSLVAAYLIWSMMDDSVPADTGTVNGVGVNGSWAAFATPSPCWSPTFIYTFVADVTDEVISGDNLLTGFDSGVTSGEDPWSAPDDYPLDDGASLIVVYSTDSSSTQQVTVYVGAETSSGSAALASTLDYGTALSSAATTTYIVEDGQLPGNAAEWNGTTIDSNAFPGSDPKATSTPWSHGNLSDTRTYSVSVPVGSTSIGADLYSTEGDCLTWVGQVLSVAVAPTPPPYSVTFSEEGLTNGTEWNITLNGTTHSGTVADLASTIGFSLGNGTWAYTVPSVPGFIGPGPGLVPVAGGSVFVRVLFHQAIYAVTFVPTGLPVTDTWWASLQNTTQGLLENTTVSGGEPVDLEVGNGTYSFAVGQSSLYTPVPASGTLTVNGSAVQVNITFVPPPLFNVTFEEQGLVAGTEWGAAVYTNFGVYSNATSTADFTLELPNTTGDDTVYAGAVAGYAAPGNVYFEVHGEAETVYVNYSVLYTVSFLEHGLPTGTYWDLYFDGVTTGDLYGYAYGPEVNFSAPNGSYTFTIESVWGYEAAPSSGLVTVNGSDTNRTVDFTPSPQYWLNFTETGLPDGTNWSVVVDLPNDTAPTWYTTTNETSHRLANGSFYYTVEPPTGFEATPADGTAEIDGANTTVSIVFAAVFSVTFVESGLPTGTYWSTYLNDSYAASTSDWLTYNESNGSYPFVLYAVGEFEPTPSSGTVVVNGSSVIERIVFASATEPTYTVTFTETGLPEGTNWSTLLEETILHSDGGTAINFTEPNGSYSFIVYDSGLLVPTPQYGTINVTGANVTEPVVYGAASTNFTVTFEEDGLPAADHWWINVTEAPSLESTGASTEINGTFADGDYDFTAQTNDSRYAPDYEGFFEVDGSDTVVDVSFYLVAYEVTFTETGLPSETEWWVNLTGVGSFSSFGTEIVVELPNGTHAYTPSSTNRTLTAPAGTVRVSGAVTSVTVPFAAPSGGSGSGAFLGLPGSDGFFLILGLAALLLLFVFLVAARRRKKEEPPKPGSPPATGGPAPPPPPT